MALLGAVGHWRFLGEKAQNLACGVHQTKGVGFLAGMVTSCVRSLTAAIASAALGKTKVLHGAHRLLSDGRYWRSGRHLRVLPELVVVDRGRLSDLTSADGTGGAASVAPIDYICGRCSTVLLRTEAGQLRGVVLRCINCATYNFTDL
jgi:hypothetical protein